MKVSQSLSNTSSAFENRKRVLQRRETSEAYRKTAQYQSPKNPILEALENLLSGKTEKELHEADSGARERVGFDDIENLSELVQPIENQGIQELKLNGDKVAIEHDPISILERVHEAALSPFEPSAQDLRVAASVVSQLQEVRGEVSPQQTEELVEDEADVEPFAGVDTSAEIPERFQADFTSRNAQERTLFGRDLEKMIYSRAFSNASSNYKAHIAMVKNGYRSFDEPSFSKMA